MFKVKRIIFALTLSIILATAGSTADVGPALAAGNSLFDNKTFNYSGKDQNGLKGEYYSNMEFKGYKITRVDSRISFDWETGSPLRTFNQDKFSVRWTGQIAPSYSEQYTFHVISDDGVRLWINNQLLIDEWKNRAATEYEGTIRLSANKRYNIKLEYFEYKADASIKLLWSSKSQEKEIIPKNRLYPVTGAAIAPTPTPTPSPTPPAAGNGLRADYFDDIDLTDPALARVDASVNFDWGTGSPDSGIGPNTFSVRWTGQVMPQYTETYTFYTVSDDGIRLWVNDKLLIDDWTEHSATENSGSIALQAGQKYSIKLEYFEKTGNASVKLSWSSASRSRQIIPDSRLYH